MWSISWSLLHPAYHHKMSLSRKSNPARRNCLYPQSLANTGNPRISCEMRGFCAGDPYGTRTHVTAVKGRCLNHLTNGPGSGNLTRTDDNTGMNRVLYQLSYAAIFLLCLTARDIISAKMRFVNNFCSVFSRFQKVFSASSTNSPKTPSRQRPATRTRRS